MSDQAPGHHAAQSPAVTSSALTLRDLLSEALAGILQRPGRSTLTALGTVLGVGTLVSIIGLTGTASAQIDSRFNALLNTQVTVIPNNSASAHGAVFPTGAEHAIARLHGVRYVGLRQDFDLPPSLPIRSSPLVSATGGQPTLVGVTPGLLRAVGSTYSAGLGFNAWHYRTSQRVAVLGRDAANLVGITTLATHPVVLIGTDAYTVVGIVSDVQRSPELLADVLIPLNVATHTYPSSASQSMLITTRPGAAITIAREAPVAISATHPQSFVAHAPPDPTTLRTSVSTDLRNLSLLLAAICVVIGGVGIANTTLVAVLERTPEIGLRRSMGALQRHITLQFVAEASLLGFLGGLIGSSIGGVLTVGVAYIRSWTPVMPLLVLALSPILGILTGVVAGIYPAWRASRIEPAVALRR